MGPEEVDATIDALREAGASVIRVTPVRKDLEEVLLDEVARGAKVDSKRLGVLT